MIIKELSYLMHYGVLGMKWGVRKDRYKRIHKTGITISRGTAVENISSNRPRNLSKASQIYVSVDKDDKQFYEGSYSVERLVVFKDEKVYKNEIVAVKDIKIPSQKIAVETFLEICRRDPKVMAESMAKIITDYERLLGVASSAQIEKLYSKTFKQYLSKGELWLKTKGYENFNRYMALGDTKAKSLYIEKLMAKGYGGIFDTNDINGNLKTNMPIVVFKPSESLKVTGSKELSYSDIDLALKALADSKSIKKDKNKREFVKMCQEYLDFISNYPNLNEEDLFDD